VATAAAILTRIRLVPAAAASVNHNPRAPTQGQELAFRRGAASRHPCQPGRGGREVRVVQARASRRGPTVAGDLDRTALTDMHDDHVLAGADTVARRGLRRLGRRRRQAKWLSIGSAGAQDRGCEVACDLVAQIAPVERRDPRRCVMSLATPARPDLEAFAEATRAEQPELVRGLRDLLGARLMAYLAGVKETRAVRQWAEGERRIQDPEVEQRLRVAFQVALMVARRDSVQVVQTWFQGLNPHLDDRSPARVLRENRVEEVGASVLAAARAFSAVG
jgi:hypothetical protein